MKFAVRVWLLVLVTCAEQTSGTPAAAPGDAAPARVLPAAMVPGDTRSPSSTESPLPEPCEPEPLRDRLLAHYGSTQGYRAVRKEALVWYGMTFNGCVAFLSTALRQLGVEVPQDEVRNGHGVSLITKTFAEYLQRELAWERFLDVEALQPGDLYFTTDAACCPGYPAHVVVFAGWKDPRRRIAWVIDNQGPKHARAAFPKTGSKRNAFAYGMRAPRRPVCSPPS